MSGWLEGCVVALLLCAGCDGLGRAVVGEHRQFAIPNCPAALPCEPLPITIPDTVPESAEPIDLRRCKLTASSCQSAATMPSGAQIAQCVTAIEDTELSLADAADLTLLGCQAARIEHTRASGQPASTRIAPELWSQVHVDIETDEPATIELTGGRLEHVSLALRGPITLRILDVEGLTDVRVRSDDPVQIELTRVRGVRLAFEAPHSAVRLRRSSLDRVRVDAQRIDLESSFVSDAIWRAAWLNAADATLLRVRAEVERSVLSASDVAMGSFSGCSSLTAIQGRFSDVQLAACSEEISLYGGTIVRGQLEGSLLLDGASLGATVLGLGTLGPITAWDTQLTDVTFCADQHSLSLGGSTSVRCAHCDLAAEPVEPDACVVAGAEPRVESSESCGVLAAPSPCSVPQPERMRPPRM